TLVDSPSAGVRTCRNPALAGPAPPGNWGRSPFPPERFTRSAGGPFELQRGPRYERSAPIERDQREVARRILHRRQVAKTRRQRRTERDLAGDRGSADDVPGGVAEGRRQGCRGRA